MPSSNHNSRPLLGFLSAYVPEELFHAAGFAPTFIFPTPDDRGRARAHLPGFTCWIVGSALDLALAGELDNLAGMALAKTCDTTQGLADLWQHNVGHIPFFHFGMPLRLDSPSTRPYLLAELESLRERIQAQTGRSITDDALWASIVLYNRTRALVRGVYARASDYSPPDLYDLVQAAFRTPKEAYNHHLAELLEKPFVPYYNGQSARLILVGPSLGASVLFDVLAEVGACVAGDLFDLGERYFGVDAADDEHTAPLESLADRLLALVHTPTKHHSTRTRQEHLLALIRERNAGGVIFARQKFCEPHGFDYVPLSHALDQAGVPHLLIELEQASQAGQLRTRVEAFVEMIT